MLHVPSRDGIRKDGKISIVGARAAAESHVCRARRPWLDRLVGQPRFWTIERVFAWEDKFRRLLLRFERISDVHYAFKTLAYTMINLRHYCQI